MISAKSNHRLIQMLVVLLGIVVFAIIIVWQPLALPLFILALITFLMTIYKFEWLLWVYIVLTPFRALELLETNAGIISPTRILLPLLIFGWFLYRQTHRHSFSRQYLQTRFNLMMPFVLFIIFVLFSTLFSQDVIWSVQNLLRFFEVIIPTAILLDMLHDERKINNAINAFVATTVLLSLTGVYEFLRDPSNLISGTDRLGWLIGHPNNLGHGIALLFPFVLFQLIREKRPGNKFLYWGILGISLVVLLFTYSRGGLLVVLISSFILVRKSLVLTLVGSLLIGILVLIYARSFFASVGQREMSVVRRQVVYATGLSASLEKPLFGYGLGNFQHLRIYYGDIDASIYQRGGEENLTAHDLYINMATETGWPSLLALLAFLGGLGVKLIRQTRNRSNKEYRAYYLLGFSVLSAACVSWLFALRLYEYANWMLLVFAVAVLLLGVNHKAMQKAAQGNYK